MAARRKAKKKATKKTARRKTSRKAKPVDLIISKSRTKNAVDLKVSSDFYGALDNAVRELLEKASERAAANKRATLRPQDL